MSTSEWKNISRKVENIFSSSKAKLEMGQDKQKYILTILAATKTLYQHVNQPLKLRESYYIGNISTQHHNHLIEAIEELEGFIKDSDDTKIKDYGLIVRSFKVMVCEETYNQSLDDILRDFYDDIFHICKEFENSI